MTLIVLTAMFDLNQNLASTDNEPTFCCIQFDKKWNSTLCQSFGCNRVLGRSCDERRLDQIFFPGFARALWFGILLRIKKRKILKHLFSSKGLV